LQEEEEAKELMALVRMPPQRKMEQLQIQELEELEVMVEHEVQFLQTVALEVED
jgi:hypothetical protein